MEQELKKRPKMTVDNIDEDEDVPDQDFVVPEKKTRKSETVLIELPRNPWNNPETTRMMDRLKLTTNQSMGFFCNIMKTGTIDGKEVDLDEFSCSYTTIWTSRNRNRGILFQLAQEEFQENKPKHSNLHWDGKKIVSFLGDEMECEAILVSGSPHYCEGKLLSVSKLPSGTGEAQLEAVRE